MKSLLLLPLLWLVSPSLLMAEDVTTVFESRKFEWKTLDGGKDAGDYRIMRPKNVEQGKTYPLVIFLHGAGERGTDNQSQLKYFPEFMAQDPNREAYPCFVLAPQCRPDKRWVEVDWSAKESTPLPEQPSEMMQMVIELTKQVMTLEQVDPQRVYLTGLSMGGYGSWDLAMRHPEWVAAVAPVCGGGDERQADRIADIPLWAFHGKKDGVVPVERTQTLITAIKQAGGEPKYTEFPEVGHNAWSFAYTQESGLLKWMFEQKNRSSESE